MTTDGIIIWSPGVTLESIEKEVILRAFNHFRKNKTATANALGIAIRTLDTKLEKYEVEEKAQVDREYGERQKRADFLDRSRGIVGQNVHPNAPQEGAEAMRNRPTAGLPMESVVNVTAKHAVPVQERSKVQTVLPSHTSQGHSRKAR